MSPAVLLLIVDISFPCSNLFYSLHFEAEPCCTIYQWLSKCINRSYPRHSNLDANILPPQCKGPFGDWEGEISQQSPAKHHHFWFVLTIDSVCWFFRVFRSFLRTSKGTSKVNTAQTPRHANQTLDLPSAKKGENNIRGWKGMVWPCKSTRKQDETSASRFLRGKKRCDLIGLFGSYLLAVNSSRVTEYGKREREPLLTTLWKETPRKDTKRSCQQLYNHKQTSL